MRIGLSGAHRTGKTTLAYEFAKKNNIEFIKTNASQIFEKNNISPNQKIGIVDRVVIQHRLLKEFEICWNENEFITDRTPLDLLGYLYCDIMGDTYISESIIDFYTKKCVEIINKKFDYIFIIQPGIPLVYEKNKAPLNSIYINHLNLVILGLSYLEKINTKIFVINENCLRISERINFIENILKEKDLL